MALDRLVTSMLGAHVLYRIGLNFEGDAVARHVLEQIAWAVAAADINDEDALRKLSATRSIGKLKLLASYAGPLYGRLSETTHASFDQHSEIVDSDGEAVSIRLAWGRHALSALTLLQLADLWVLAYESTQRDHMTKFAGLNPEARYTVVSDREFIGAMRSLVTQIEEWENFEQNPSLGEPKPDDGKTIGDRGESPLPEAEDGIDWDAVLEERRPADGTIASHIDLLSEVAWLTDKQIMSRLSDYRVPEQARHALTRLPNDFDLREISIPFVEDETPTRNAMVSELLCAPGFHFLEPWMGGIALGELASLQVYSFNATGEWMGKAHAPGRCQHKRYIQEGDLMSLSE